MKEYTINAFYTISVQMTIEAESYDEAMEIAESCDGAMDTEWNGNSVFVNVSALDSAVTEMTLEADGMLRDFECDDYDEEEDEDYED